MDVLQGIHGTGIVHTDLRIDNLMINDEGDVFIIDFDCADDYQDDNFEERCDRDMAEMLECLGSEWPFPGESAGEDADQDDGPASGS